MKKSDTRISTPPPPEPSEPDPVWEHIGLFRAVKNAIFTLPSRFESDLVISGVLATDLFAFNSSLGATIEEQVVSALNKLRTIWDPNQRYALYAFERRPQTFPDVVLKTSAPDASPQVLLGLELKGWYVLAKEREPSFRYKVTPAVCAPADLLIVVPWALSNVISGSPRVFAPFVIGARHAAEYRNWYWRYGKSGAGNNSITLSTQTDHYPRKSDMISDVPASDKGGNFGRLARARVMDKYIAELFDDKLAGISLGAWQRFLALFTESVSASELDRSLERLSATLGQDEQAHPSAEIRSALYDKFQEIAEILSRTTRK